MLPTDLVSVIWGAVGGAIVTAVFFIFGTFAKGFLGEAGKQSFTNMKDRLDPPEPEPILVDRRFDETLPTDLRAWVREESVHRKLREGYSYYVEETRNAKCYRKAADYIEYLMVCPRAFPRDPKV